jgi:hypothetical protein
MNTGTMSNYWIGRKGELYAQKFVLIGSILETDKNRNALFDISWEGYRVNVKVAKLRHYKGCNEFVFQLHQHHENCDFFLFMGYQNRRDKDFLQAWLIPSDMTINEKTGEPIKALTLGLANKGRFKHYKLEYKKRNERN